MTVESIKKMIANLEKKQMNLTLEAERLNGQIEAYRNMLRMMDNSIISFPDYLRQFQQKEKMSFAEIGELLGVSDATIYNWVNGTRKPVERIKYIVANKLAELSGGVYKPEDIVRMMEA